MIATAIESGARQRLSCETVGISERTFQRWTCEGQVHADKRPQAPRPQPANKLSDAERALILKTCHQPEHESLPPSQIVPRLADQGLYIGSESSFYRVLHEADQQHHRGRAQADRKLKTPTTHTASGANQVWTWDISYLPSSVHGLYFYLYLIVDIYSRKIVGWEVHPCESGELAAQLIERAVLSERCFRQPLVLHSDNGSPMKSQTMQMKLYDLGIIPSHSRPRVSNDNPFSESLFRTLKYCPQWPSGGFESIEAARQWVNQFVLWYNHEHRHSAIRFVTPQQRHLGEDERILIERKRVYEQAKRAHPARWSGETRNWTPAGPVTLNPERIENLDSQMT